MPSLEAQVLDNQTPQDTFLVGFECSPLFSPSQLYNLRESGALYRIDLEDPTYEQRLYLGALANGHLSGIPISDDRIRAAGIHLADPIGRVPDQDLLKKWSSNPLTSQEMLEPFPVIAAAIVQARKTVPTANIEIDPSAVLHVEAQDFTQPGVLDQYYCYLKGEGLHIRRIEMLTDLGLIGIRKALANKGRASLVNFGTGPLPLERNIIAQLNPSERAATTITGFDVSKDLILYGLHGRYLDKGVAVDVMTKRAEYFGQHAPEADVVVFGEILEHIDHHAVVFKKSILPWLKQTGAMLIGSVPNSVQLAEFIPLITGSGSSHQLRRPIFDTNSDHHTFHTADSLAEMLTNTWGFNEAGIVSNGVRVQRQRNAAHLYAGLDNVGVGDRLVFWARG